MSNRRRPQRRDAHGAPIRTRQEIWVAVATAVGVLLVSVLLVWITRNRPPSVASPTITSPSSVSSTATKPAGSSTTTKPAGSSTTTSTIKPAGSSTSSSTKPASTSTTKP